MTARFTMLLSLFLIFSCGSSDSTTTNTNNWTLIQINTGLSGKVLEDDALPFTQSLELKSDSTFVKIRNENGQRHEAKGTYSIQNEESRQIILLNNTSENDLIINCTRSLQEYHQLQNGLLTGGGLACDAPGLTYTQK